jgi:hypothetical protein
MVLSEVEREITNDIVQTFLRENRPSPRKTLARTFKSSQSFHRLTGWNIIANVAANVPTGQEEYLPRALAFYYAGDPEALRIARKSVSIVVRSLQRLFYVEPDKTQFTPGDLKAQADKVFNIPPGQDMLKLGLYLVHDIGILTLWSPAYVIEPELFSIAEHIVEIGDPDKVWDDFIARSAPHDVQPQPAIIPIDSEGASFITGSSVIAERDDLSRIRREAFLRALLRAARDPSVTIVTVASLAQALSLPIGLLRFVVDPLVSEGLITTEGGLDSGSVVFTEKGMVEANEVVNRRIPSRTKTKILCVDTEPETTQGLKDAGYTVFEVSMGYRTGKRAFPFPAPNEVHLILCDLRRPACFDSRDWGPTGGNDNFRCRVVPPGQIDNSFYLTNGRRRARFKVIQETQLGKPTPGTFGPKEVNRAIAEGGVPFLLFLNEEWLKRTEEFPNWLDVRWAFLPTVATEVTISEPLQTLLPEVGREIKFKLAIQHRIEHGPSFGRMPPRFQTSTVAVVGNNVGDVFGQLMKMGKGTVWLIPATHQNLNIVELFASRLELVRQLSLSPQAPPSISKGEEAAADKMILGPQSAPKGAIVPNSNIRVFISHSSADVEIAKALIDLLRDAIPDLHPNFIRCTSVPGYKLHGGADTDNQLREEMRGAKVFVGLLTYQSLASTYVLFELGARWGASSQMTPLVAAGLLTSQLKAPLNGMHVQSCELATDLHQMLREIAEGLRLKVAGADVYDSRLKELAELSRAEGKKRLSETASSVASAAEKEAREEK